MALLFGENRKPAHDGTDGRTDDGRDATLNSAPREGCISSQTLSGWVCYVCVQVLRAIGNSYHVECFRCNACHMPLHQQQFTVDIQSRPHCIADYIRSVRLSIAAIYLCFQIIQNLSLPFPKRQLIQHRVVRGSNFYDPTRPDLINFSNIFQSTHA